MSSFADFGVGAIGAAIPTVATIYLAISSRRTKERVETVRADGQAYDRAQKINEQVVAQLRTEITRLQSELDEMRQQLRAEQNRSSELERHVRELQASIDRMRALLLEQGIEP